ncbi:MAG: tetratricopeptide repeat protein, partial [Gammaproteobacteria bacterium]
ACEQWLQEPDIQFMIRNINKGDGHYDLHIHCQELLNHQSNKKYVENILNTHSADLMKEAENGDVLAQFAISIAYEEGLLGYPVDLKLSTEWLKKAAAQGNPYALLEMGVCYFLGKGIRQDDRQAINFFKQAAATQIFPSAYIAEGNLGLMYCFGYGVTIDLKQGITWLELAASHGHPQSMRRLAGYYTRGCVIFKPNLEKAFAWYKQAAEAGDAYSQFNVAVFYQAGDGGEEINLEQAFRWYLTAARGGDADGMCGVASCYLHGWGTPVDINAALPWINAAIEKGHADAYYNLAKYYEQKGDAINNLESLKLAAINNSLFALYTLIMRKEGDTSALLNQLAEHPIEDLLGKAPQHVLFLLARLLLDKTDSKKNKKCAIEKAITILEHLAATKNAMFYTTLSIIYSCRRWVINPDYKKAFTYAETGRQLGDVDCLYVVANAYNSGKGIEKNLQQAQIYQQELLEKKHMRCHLDLIHQSLNERIKNFKEAKTAVSELRQVLILARTEHQNLADNNMYKEAFFLPTQIEKETKKLLGWALFHLARIQLESLTE